MGEICRECGRELVDEKEELHQWEEFAHSITRLGPGLDREWCEENGVPEPKVWAIATTRELTADNPEYFAKCVEKELVDWVKDRDVYVWWPPTLHADWDSTTRAMVRWVVRAKDHLVTYEPPSGSILRYKPEGASLEWWDGKESPPWSRGLKSA